MGIQYLIQSMDKNILLFINQYFNNIFLDGVFVFTTSLGNLGIIWIIIAAVLLLNKKYKKTGILLLVALLLSTALAEGIFKHLVNRPRPFYSMPNVKLLINKPFTSSFPSGHSASSFASAGILSKYINKYKSFFYALASLIAFSRLYLFVHYPSDVIAGILLGIVCSKIVISFGNKFKITS